MTSTPAQGPTGATASAIVARLRPFGGTIFAEMSERARVHGAVNLGQGFPDWDGPPRMLEIAREQIAGGRLIRPQSVYVGPQPLKAA